MRKTLMLSLVGALLASPALACGWGAGKTAADESKQTVMTEPSTKTPAPSAGG